MRRHHLEARALRRFDLRLEEARIGARHQIDQIELVVDRVIEALHPLRRLALVLPDLEVEADVALRLSTSMLWMVLMKGTALEAGIERIDLPFMQAAASKASPGA